MGWKKRVDLRLRVLGTAGLAAGLAASSHFDGLVGGLKVGGVGGMDARLQSADASEVVWLWRDG